MVDFTNDSSETLAFSEAGKVAYGQAIAEKVEFDAYYPATPRNFVGSDFAIYNTAFTADEAAEFIRTRAPVGYSPFRDFVAGEYQFRKAYVDFVFTPIDGADGQLSLTQATVIADVPDKTETNTATITVAASGATVSFSTTFVVAPKVILTPIGATAQTAVLTATPTTTGFTAKLFDSNGTAVTGTFFWTAIGY